MPGAERAPASPGEYQYQIEMALERANLTGKPILLSVSVPTHTPDPVTLFSTAQRAGEDTVLWQLPAEGLALVGIGILRSLAATGPDRFSTISRDWRELTRQVISLRQGEDDAGLSPGPILIGGFAFDAGGATGPWTRFGDARLTLPQITFVSRQGDAWVTVNTLVEPGTEPTALQAALATQLSRAELIRAGVDFEMKSDDVRDPASAQEPSRPRSTKATRAEATENTRAPAPPASRPLHTEDLHPVDYWLAAVDRVAAEIRSGTDALEKAVLARALRITSSEDFDPVPALRYLQAHYPECYTYAVSHGEATFLGATPERIVRREGERIDVACLAGSTARGSTPAEDQDLADELLQDPKNLREHEVVLHSILDALEPVAEEVNAAPHPSIRKLANVQHLYTPVTARIAPDREILDLVDRIHPTPAIGGHPTRAALELIRREEGFDRGWYAGPIGWLDAAGQGEFVVGLRSALLQGDEAILYAGCGIMGDSDPVAEYDESVLKLRPMLTALGIAEPAAEPAAGETADR